MATLWRYRRDGQEFGPVTSDDLKLLAESQRLVAADLVRKEGSSRWVPARSVRGLFDDGRPRGLLARAAALWGRSGLIASGLGLVVVVVGSAALAVALHSPASAGAGAPPGPPPASPAPPPAAEADKTPPKNLVAALHDLRESRAELRDGERDGGDAVRDAARAVDRAADQVEKSLHDGGYDVPDARRDPEAHRKYADHSHLRRARDEIIEARVELRDAKDALAGEGDRVLRELSFAAERLGAVLDHAR